MDCLAKETFHYMWMNKEKKNPDLSANINYVSDIKFEDSTN